MPGLLDMYDPSGQAQQLGFFDTIGQNRNSLIGLGLGLAGSSQPGFGDALQGFQRGASQDAQERARIGFAKIQPIFALLAATAAEDGEDHDTMLSDIDRNDAARIKRSYPKHAAKAR